MKKNILVVDDDRSIRELIGFKLTQRGFEVRAAKNGTELRELALEQRPDLIILDIWLRGKIGTDLYHELLRSGLDPTIPVIFITGLTKAENPRRAFAGGKYAFHPKPFRFDELLEDIEFLTNHYYREPALYSHT